MAARSLTASPCEPLRGQEEADADAPVGTLPQQQPQQQEDAAANGLHEATSLSSPSRLTRSRRKRWLELNPSYFAGASGDLELSDPLSYDRLIRRHQSAADREREGKNKGWAKTLESSLVRGEAKLAALKPGGDEGNEKDGSEDAGDAASAGGVPRRMDWSIEGYGSPGDDIESAEVGTRDGDENGEEAAEVKSRGERRWKELLAQRFILGEDDDFDYTRIDGDEELDGDEGISGTWLERQRQERWFAEEESDSSKSPSRLEGQTGVQDF